jgi:tryptophan synthase alpha chain
MTKRLENKLNALKAQSRAGFVPFIMGGDPDAARCADILRQLPQHGADIIELGMPFSDPMADGPAIQAAGLRALKKGTTLKTILQLVRGFRETDQESPLVLMGYVNPIYHYGTEQFMQDAAKAGADALILVDAPLEEKAEFEQPAKAAGLDFIRLVAPTSLETRLNDIAHEASGFLYYISMKGITGSRTIDTSALKQNIEIIKKHSALPVAVGFGISTAEDVKAVAQYADLVVVGSTIVRVVEKYSNSDQLVQEVLNTCQTLAKGI